MKNLTIHIAAIMIVILFNDHFCQSPLVKQIKSINSEEVKLVQKKSKRTLHIEVIKPMIENEIINAKSKQIIEHPNPPQRPHRRPCYPPISTIRRSEVNVSSISSYRCRSGSFNTDLVENEFEQIDEIEILYQEQSINYHLNTKFFNDIEFTDEDFPICIKGIELEYLQNQWIDSEDFPEYMNYKKSGEYLSYSIELDVYVIEQNYSYPLAALITFPDLSNEIIVFNYDSKYLNSDSEYFLQEEIHLEKTGYAWFTLGYYDFERNQFYSAVLSPYLTKQKIYIPDNFEKQSQINKI